MTDPVIDYRVDSAKLRFRAAASPGEVGQPPVQCPARRPAPRLKGLSVWTYLVRGFFRLFDSPRDRLEEDRAYEYARQCQCFDGHWYVPEQREHVNGYGERWPVTAADTARLNPGVAE